MDRLLAQTLQIRGGNAGGGVDIDTIRLEGVPGWRFNSLADVINAALPYIIVFAGLGLLLMVITAGFTMMTSAGDSKKMHSAQQRLTWGVVGTLVILTAFWVVQMVGTIFGIRPFTGVFN